MLEMVSVSSISRCCENWQVCQYPVVSCSSTRARAQSRIYQSNVLSGRFVASVTGIINRIRESLKRCTIVKVVAGGVM